MKNFLISLLSILLLTGLLLTCASSKPDERPGPMINIIPLPQNVEMGAGAFNFPASPTVKIDQRIQNDNFLHEFLGYMIPGLARETAGSATIELLKDESGVVADEGYVMHVEDDRILITANDDAGILFGVQTLRQLLPANVEQGSADLSSHTIPVMRIEDYPRFKWRGMHLDVSRHFFPADFIKQYIDMIAFHKMNTFHWHLTDDNGWRLEIKQYPELTEISAWRVDREHENWRRWSPIQEGEKATYGGFYTQEEVREIVAYAADRNINVIPEIEMPGHTSEVFAAFPELSCRGERLHVIPGSYWPNEDIFCAGNDSVFNFLENVIDEVVELFPADYIHIGGDEARKTYWETCPKCQARIKKENLADEHELQSWFLRKMEKYINGKGKRLIGWDEILEGGLAPEATVMSWRGEAGGVKAAKAGHDVIMTPTSHCYFDYYQGDPETEPEAIGGYLPLMQVYSYEPIPSELKPEEHKYVLGSQANLWTEWVKTPSHAEYMVLPRMSALSEVIWSSKAARDWENFQTRIPSLFRRFDALGWNYSPGTYLVEIIPGRLKRDQVNVRIKSEQPRLDIRYTIDGSEPNLTSEIYQGKISLQQDATVRAALFDSQERKGRVNERAFVFHQALRSKTDYHTLYDSRYTAGGEHGLVDGILGSENFRDGTWQGFEGNDLNLLIDLGELKDIFQVEMNFLQTIRSWIFMPDHMEVKLSGDGENWKTISKVLNEIPEKQEGIVIQRLTADFPTENTRYIKVLVKNKGVCPDWHAGAGGSTWFFTDEVIVR